MGLNLFYHVWRVGGISAGVILQVSNDNLNDPLNWIFRFV